MHKILVSIKIKIKKNKRKKTTRAYMRPNTLYGPVLSPHPSILLLIAQVVDYRL
jgi:hypothetical protein